MSWISKNQCESFGFVKYNYVFSGEGNARLSLCATIYARKSNNLRREILFQPLAMLEKIALGFG